MATWEPRALTPRCRSLLTRRTAGAGEANMMFATTQPRAGTTFFSTTPSVMLGADVQATMQL